MEVRIHGFTPYSKVNGPGERSVLHLQGCRFACPGCFNPETHSLDAGQVVSVDTILSWIPIEVGGVTISGGEPFLQQEALLELVRKLRLQGKSLIIFSGFYHREIMRLRHGVEILSYVDALIDGRFDQEKMSVYSLHGSDNQRVHLFTDRYNLCDFQDRDIEITFDLVGNVSITGFPTESILKQFKR
ncbi:4Fe-4S single cluster domain-containing protein [Brevibacillus reuszeri]|uniref:4Fe-4S single cluster domain-containing protein n=1 Tax=Brevibacillus reuszeri TaxID=54915 RepID=UPI0013DF14B8|nr:4Fe-4S single cluster domain-containing protein [Brevibacillus reuszeri]